MQSVFLEVSFLRGKPFAAYLRLPRPRDAKVARTREVRPGVLVDFTAEGVPMGVEIVNPASTSVDTIQQVLAEVHSPPVAPEELAPLRAA